MADVSGGHAGVELAAVTAALITVSRIQFYRTVTTHQTTKTKAKITRARSGPKQEQRSTTPQRVYALLMWLAGVDGVK